MTSLQQLCSEYEYNKYLQLFAGSGSDILAEASPLRDALSNLVELAIVRLGVFASCVVLSDGDTEMLLAGGHRHRSQSCSDVEFEFDTAWLRVSEEDRPARYWLLQKTLAIDSSTTSTTQRTFVVPDLRDVDPTSTLGCVKEFPHLTFFAGTPMVSAIGQNIGTLFVLDNSGRNQLSASETGYLVRTADKCKALLEFARERQFHERWANIQVQLDVFIQSRSLVTQMLEEPSGMIQKVATETHSQRKPEREEPDEIAADSLEAVVGLKVEGQESKRVLQAELERDRRIVEEDKDADAGTLTAEATEDEKRSSSGGETVYHKVFRRAAQCLQEGMKVDGVLFVDGLVAFHGGDQPAAETEQELEREIVASPSWENAYTGPGEAPPPQEKTARQYTSAEYQKGYYLERPAEVLGVSPRISQLRTKLVTQSTVGLVGVDEGFLQRLMDRHPAGAVWYFDGDLATQVEGETLEESNHREELERLRKAIPGSKQLLFQPLSDPTSSKRLAGCFAWRNETLPLFTDRVDLSSVKGFLHVVESEIARFDAAAAVKQQERFVSSVSHELRTPLHGILGAVQLFDSADLNPLHSSLVDTISSCGSTLHETLISVLSYAKINQLERRQHKYRHQRPPGSIWGLAGKRGLIEGPDRDFEGLYIRTNIAMLCEEIIGVLDAGQLFNKSHDSEKLIVTFTVQYNENWFFNTEPGALRRVAANLLGNALKYTYRGSVTVTLTACQILNDKDVVRNDLGSGRTVILTVKDTGKGISKDFMENQLFVPFTQENTATSHGVGLGMSIVKSLVSLLGGEIDVQSEVGKGTEMCVKIPMARSEPDEGAVSIPEMDQNIQILRNRHLAVVLFSFPAPIHTALVSYLRDWFKCTILEATDDANPDVVLVDEGNEKVLEAVRKTAHSYGRHGVLLSITRAAGQLGTPMRLISGYKKWKRVPRPMGPVSMAKGMLACLAELDKIEGGGDKFGSSTHDGRQSVENEPDNQQESRVDTDASEKSCTPPKKESQLSAESTKNADTPRTRTTEAEPSKAPPPTAPPEALSVSASKQPFDRHVAKAPSDLHVLLVDDNVLNLKLLEAFLKKSGYLDIQQAHDGAEAVGAFQKHAPGFDIIFMDLSMPIMNGFEATRRIRRLEAERNRPKGAETAVIVALTGLASARDEDDAFKAGVDMFITKPVKFGELSSLLQRCQEGGQRERDEEEEKG
ncbi:hypothetical protein BDV95DRAFT_122460 [Massariosphaeria phaeospora]|uniref:histidine kinase n=1 Tax=Massariosphaeria phaeospora TaxID=100035 RepID=A0A7C8I228_9PLEO|nr:hypothetical protein BDV95DRAFT_122460 [Massariosphaeria phaeospora]